MKIFAKFTFEKFKGILSIFKFGTELIFVLQNSWVIFLKKIYDFQLMILFLLWHQMLELNKDMHIVFFIEFRSWCFYVLIKI